MFFLWIFAEYTNNMAGSTLCLWSLWMAKSWYAVAVKHKVCEWRPGTHGKIFIIFHLLTNVIWNSRNHILLLLNSIKNIWIFPILWFHVCAFYPLYNGQDFDAMQTMCMFVCACKCVYVCVFAHRCFRSKLNVARCRRNFHQLVAHIATDDSNTLVGNKAHITCAGYIYIYIYIHVCRYISVGSLVVQVILNQKFMHWHLFIYLQLHLQWKFSN